MWKLEEALDYYKKQGAPGDQSALIGLLKEMQTHMGSLNPESLAYVSQTFSVKQTLLEGIIKRIPGLRLEAGHLLEICDGPNCPRRAALGRFVEQTYGTKPSGFQWKYVPCMRMCGKGPNIKWDGKIYHGADQELIIRLVENKE